MCGCKILAGTPDPLSSPYQCMPVVCTSVYHCTRTSPLSSPYQCLSMRAVCTSVYQCTSVPMYQCTSPLSPPYKCMPVVVYLQLAEARSRVAIISQVSACCSHHQCTTGSVMDAWGTPGGRGGEDTPSMPLVTLHVCRTLLLQNICQRRQVGCCASVLCCKGGLLCCASKVGCCAVLPMVALLCFAILCCALLYSAAGSKDRGGS